MVRIGSFYLSFSVWLHLKALAVFVTHTLKAAAPKRRQADAETPALQPTSAQSRKKTPLYSGDTRKLHNITMSNTFHVLHERCTVRVGSSRNPLIKSVGE